MGIIDKDLKKIQEKAKERTVKTQNIEYDLETLVGKIKKKSIKLNPEYQRNHRWNELISSKLIESLILNIPIPVIYLSQDIDVDAEVSEGIARYSVIDGQQRLTAIYEFFENKYALQGLVILEELNGLFYEQLPSFLTRRLEERTIKCLRIDSTLDSQVKYDIFERLNSGSVELEPQELRNATCKGKFSDVIKNLSSDKDFMGAVRIKENSPRQKKMEDQELILRFFAVSYEDGYLEYKAGWKNFLTNKLNYFNKLPDENILEMEKIFNGTLAHISKNMSINPFSKYKLKDGSLERMSLFNAAVYDVVMLIAFKDFQNNTNYLSDEKVKELFRNKTFFHAVEGSVNDNKKLLSRINLGLQIFP